MINDVRPVSQLTTVGGLVLWIRGSRANGKMRTCGDAACSLGLVGLGLRVKDKVRVSVKR